MDCHGALGDYGAPLLCNDTVVGLMNRVSQLLLQERAPQRLAPIGFVSMWDYKDWVNRRGEGASVLRYNPKCFERAKMDRDEL